MNQVLQSLSDGSTTLAAVPVPRASGHSLVIESRASVISAGTERMLVDFGRASLLDKARQQPDKVRQVLQKIRTDGLAPTIEAVKAKLDTPIPLGYCNAGVVVEVGPRASQFAPGDRVVSNGPHAEYVRVPHTLAARIPGGVEMEAAAFTPLAAIGLQGFRLAQPTLGETVVVYGLGLIGLLTVQIARAAGCSVIGIDRSSERAQLASRWGARTIVAEDGVDVADAVIDFTGGTGADVVLLTLATHSDEPVRAAAAMARKRGRLVLIGVTGLSLQRDDFYRKELSFQVSCSYGPGRYDPEHEEKGIDYPLPFVRWTEGRNFSAVLGLMADGRLDPLPLISHRFGITDAPAAYGIVAGSEPSLAVVLGYPEKKHPPDAESRTIAMRPGDSAAGSGAGAGAGAGPRVGAGAGAGRVGLIGAGNFAYRTLIPALAAAGAELETIASAGGTSAAVVGGARGFRRATTDAEAMLNDPALDTIVVATRHDSHAEWVVRALEAGKNVFVEKPLALTEEELERVGDTLTRSSGLLCVGFNRRFAPLVVQSRKLLSSRTGPLAISMLVNAGELPGEHWTRDPESGGGRIVGEACHFIDLARHLADSSIVSMRVTTARGPAGGARDTSAAPVEDIALIQLAFADGSIASVQYLANGAKDFPKERIELIWDGRVIRIDNFRKLKSWGATRLPSMRVMPSTQDKGHAKLAAAFIAAVRGSAPPPIPVNELLESSLWAIRAGALAAAGGGEA